MLLLCGFIYVRQEFRNKLQATQNKVIKCVMDLDLRTHIGKDQFSYLNWLPVASRVDFLSLCHVFKIASKTAPSYMMEYFTIHTYSTRFRVNATSTSDYSFVDSGRFYVPVVKGFGRRTFAYRGWLLWNTLP